MVNVLDCNHEVYAFSNFSSSITLNSQLWMAVVLKNPQRLICLNEGRTKILGYKNPFGIMFRVFTNGPGDLYSIPGRVVPKTQKMVLETALLTLGIIRYVSRVKWSNTRKGVVSSPTLWCSSYQKGNPRVPLDYGRQLYSLLYFERSWISVVCEKQTDTNGDREGRRQTAILTHNFFSWLYYVVLSSSPHLKLLLLGWGSTQQWGLLWAVLWDAALARRPAICWCSPWVSGSLLAARRRLTLSHQGICIYHFITPTYFRSTT